MDFLTHGVTALAFFTAGYCWCFRTWNQWEAKRPPSQKGKP